MNQKKFYRDRGNRMFLGVLSGISKTYNIDLKLLRIGTVILALFTNVAVVILYFIVALLSEEK